jgi:4-aminobutyrate aminotransferase-like enzyme/Ser/Thr protein kinase RdoA (MazF antagonist)
VPEAEAPGAGPGAVGSRERFQNPKLSAARAAAIAAEHWGVEASATDVGSLQDQNFRLRAGGHDGADGGDGAGADDGAEYVLKVANAAIPAATLAMEHEALRWLAPRLEGVAVPRPLATADGAEVITVDGWPVRLMTWVPGAPMAALGHLDEDAMATLGALAAEAGAALVDFDHPGVHRSSQWDTRVAAAVVEAIAPRLEPGERAELEMALAPLRGLDPALTGALPTQAIHSDVTDHNVVGGTDAEGRFLATGLIDFGDLVHTWRVCDPASAAVSAIASWPADPLGAALAVLDGYRSRLALEEAELEAYWPAVLARAAVCAASSSEQKRESPGNPYAVESAEVDWAILRAALSVPPALATAAVRAAAGLDPVSGVGGGAAASATPDATDVPTLLASLGTPHSLCRPLGDKVNGVGDGTRTDWRLVPIDLGVDSPRLGEGAWASAEGLAAAVAVGDGEIAVGRWAEVRLPHAGAPGEVAPATLHLGADLFLDAGTEVAAPLAGEVVAIGDRELTIALGPTAAPSGVGKGRYASQSRTGRSESDGGAPEPPRLDNAPPALFLRLAGIEPTLVPGDRVEPGATVGRVAAPTGGAGVPAEGADRSGATYPPAEGKTRTGADAPAPLPPHLHVQLSLAPDLPGLGDPRRRDAWLALCPDPSPLLGIDAAAPAPPDPAAERARREAVLAGAQSLYYREPLEIVRGWRATLFDSDARPYVDVVNNVAAVGHSHPGVTAAAHEQLRLLNTNSRFLYGSLTEYAERVAALLPPELDRVFVVNSGSEALDLAVQLGRVYTGRRDLAAIFGAYHGWTESVYEACTSPQDNPGWRDTIPPWVHVVDLPDPNRGVHGADAAAYVDSVRAACAAAARTGEGIAAFLSEALLGNQGAVVPPPGYLAAAYEAVRAAGGVCIADEVQVGYARTGSDFWAFEHEGVVPDIIATAKATGNGHPIGVVACRAEIAAALGRRASFFSSTGGGPVSCRVGIAVLDAIRDEGLQERAAEVGGHLKAALERLAERHPAIGAVNGRGLYLGVDIVADRATKEPAPAEAAAICERLRQLGVIVQPTGDEYNFLKVKPPMCIGTEEADHFVAMLDRVLGERERIAELAL